MVYALVSVLIISAISFVGVFTLSIKEEILKKGILYLVSFSAGAIFGDVFLHLLPEFIEEHGWELQTSFLVLFGIIFLFIVEKLIQWRHCHHGVHEDECVRPFAYTNLIGDGFHNLIDGVIIGASYLVSIPTGIATTIAVALHEIPQEVGDFGVLLHSGFTKKRALLLNFLLSLSAIAGLFVVILFSDVEIAASVLVPFAIGNFIYIAGADLIPELHTETRIKQSAWQLVAFILGIGVMSLFLFLEFAH
jgi:zinc and cadmium transporter